MKKAWIIAAAPGIAAVAVGVGVLTLLIVKALWSWVIPDIFPGAVSQGLIARSLSWYSAFKLAVFAAFLSAMLGGVNIQSK